MSEMQEKSSDREQFISYLEKASEVVRTWPSWKQAILGLPQNLPAHATRNVAPATRNVAQSGLHLSICPFCGGPITQQTPESPPVQPDVVACTGREDAGGARVP